MDNARALRGPGSPFNPYASPSTSVGPVVDEFGYPVLEFGVFAILSRSWAIFRSRMGLCILATFGPFLLASLGLACLGLLDQLLVQAGVDPGLVGLTLVAGFLILAGFSVWVSVGMTIVMLKVARGRLASWGTLFSGGRFVLPFLVASFLVTFLTLAAMAPALVPLILTAHFSKLGTAGGIWILGLAIPVALLLALILSLRFSLFTYFLVDRNVGPIAALRLSSRATSGNLPKLVMILLVVGAINAAGALAFLIGEVVTAPFGLVTLAVTYTALERKTLKTRSSPARTATIDPDF